MAKEKGRVLSIDIGNTGTHMGIVDTGSFTCFASCVFPTTDMEKCLLSSIDALVNSDSFQKPGVVSITGVVKDAVRQAVYLAEKDGFEVRVGGDGNDPLPFSLDYASIGTLGNDRLANAMYVRMRYPHDDAIIISAGTALVIDCMIGGTFIGGAILPGVALQFKALYEFTDALPLVENGKVGEPLLRLPGKSTESCIRSGVMYGTAGAANSIVSHYLAQSGGQQPVVFATGGGWPALAPLVDFDPVVIPEMTLVGTALMTCRHCRNTATGGE